MEVTNSCPLHDSFRVQQIAGMFNVPLPSKLTESFSVDVPPLGDDWRIGLIVGPSGSGKTTLARQLFGEQFVERVQWPTDRAVVDCFGERPIREITGLLTAVGFSSPPSWIKPYAVLSGGERFRCDLARALACADAGGVNRNPQCQRVSAASDPGHIKPCVEANPPRDIVAFDEFTSVVDRTVAKIGSAAVAKAVRDERVRSRFVAVTCHYDVIDWLAPDWIIDLATRAFQRRCLRRPPIQLDIVRTSVTAWPLFAKHHYLSGSLNPAARCYLALWHDKTAETTVEASNTEIQPTPVAFCATLPIYGRKGHWRVSRIVTLPDYQGVGIGMNFVEAVAELHRAERLRMSITASHPSVIGHCQRSPLWRATAVKKCNGRSARSRTKYTGDASGRAVVSFEYRREAAR